ncbi:unnamed protein product [Paramecium primaurelia]|uniref:MORN repeat protein n=1 Tax=Paramecium primaurelia TaxID=5886 RepID=A0A8S1NAS5_PARPR|nr:unnamed protein product [Paramecium primaurelia]
MYISGVQDGMWKEVNERFQNDCKIFYFGQFDIGKKIGRWNVIFQDTIMNFRGGGDYDNQGMKTGRWVDQNNNFFREQKSGKYYVDLILKKQFESIGSGQYDEKGIKHDFWIEPIEHIWRQIKFGCSDCNQLGLNNLLRQYQNNGEKIGRWEILYKEENSEKFELIGGGCYDENGMISGEWAKVDSKFSYSCQVIQKGQQLKGRKVERWNYHFWEKIMIFIVIIIQRRRIIS